MCGIAGILGGQARAPELVRAMTAAMVHRGPDAAGFFDDTCVALGMRRLAIVDVAAGNQPQSNEAGTVWIVFNGEIYNHADLRAQLQKHGHVFRTASDTEVIVHGYEQWGIDGCLERLWGMFAFLLWDAARRELFAARDRLGIKPLYYMRANGQWRFASEVKALLACPDAPRAVNTDAIGLYLLHQYVPAPATFFAGVRKVLPGHYLKFDAAGTMTQRPFWRLSFDPSGTPPSFPDAAAEVRERVTEAVRLRLMSEVPLGCLLSGGLDSAVVATTMARLSNQPVRTFTVGFPEVPGIDERPYARLVAEHCHAAHTELEVSLDATALLDRAVYHLDEPLADAAALPTLAICEAAREHVTVLLTGEGSDELFAGYPRYALSRAADALQRIPPQARGTALQALGALVPEGRARNALGRLARDPGDALARNALWTGVFTPTDVARLYPNGPPALAQPEMADWPYTADTPPHNGLNRLLYWDLRRWLVDDVLMKVDKMSMAASVEARVPFLDHELVEYVASLPASYKLRRGRGKAVLREAFREWLPAQTSARRKAAFRPPLDAWFRGKLGLLANERLRARGSFCRSFLDARAVERVLADHMTGVANNGQRLWTLLCAELWYGQWFGAEREARRSLDRGDAALRISGKSGAGEGTLTLTLSHGDVGEGEVDLSGCEAPGRRFSVASAARAVRGVLLVPDLPSERWPSMDRYARGLLEHLAGIDRDYVVAAPVLNGRNGHRTLASARRYWDRLVAYPASLRSYRPDVIHVLDHTYAHVLRKFGGRPSLVTVHDLWPLRRPHNNSAARQMLLDTLVRRITEGAQSATLLCADSSFSAGEAHELLGIPAARLRVVPLGVEESFFESAAADDVRTFRQVMFSRGGPRLLHVGSCDPRKNIDALLRIVAAIRRAAGRVRLLQVGGRFTTAQRALISELKLDTAVAQRCDLSEVELRLAYQAADVLVLPSLYEGFGFPVLEAQASRLPVVCSNCASLPEVAGDGARLVDGFAPTRWSRTVLEIVESRENRNRMIEAGLRNARRYTWAATARAVSLIYQELLGDPPSNEL